MGIKGGRGIEGGGAMGGGGHAPCSLVLLDRDGSKSFFASPSQVTSHFLASPSQVTSHFLASPSQVTSHLVRRQVKSQVIWSKHKSSHKSLCPSTSQVAHLVQL